MEGPRETHGFKFKLL